MKKLLLLLSLVSFSWDSMACTAVDVKAQDGSVVAGRTMEWAFDMQWQFLYYPKGTEYPLTAPDNLTLKPIPVTNKYALFGIGTAIEGNAILDGQNSEGLAISGNFLPGFTQYQEVTAQDTKYLSVLDLCKFVLGNFASVDEVKAQLPQYKVWGPKIKNLPIEPTIHFLITDKTGKNIVIEFINGQMHIFNQTAGVLTNSPNYDWHMTNLRNYLSLSNQGTNQRVAAKGYNVTQLGQGGGSIGLPGDYTPPSRFVKTTFLKYFATTSVNANEAVELVGHILNNVDISKGVVAEEGSLSDYTQWTAIKDVSHNIFYFADYDHRLNFVGVDLNTIFSQTKAFSFPIDKVVYPSSDITKNLLASK